MAGDDPLCTIGARPDAATHAYTDHTRHAATNAYADHTRHTATNTYACHTRDTAANEYRCHAPDAPADGNGDRDTHLYRESHPADVDTGPTPAERNPDAPQCDPGAAECHAATPRRDRDTGGDSAQCDDYTASAQRDATPRGAQRHPLSDLYGPADLSATPRAGSARSPGSCGATGRTGADLSAARDLDGVSHLYAHSSPDHRSTCPTPASQRGHEWRHQWRE